MPDEFKIPVAVDAADAVTGAKEASGAMENLGGAVESGGKKGKIFEGHMREVRKAIRELGHEFPVAGMALRAFVSPIGASIAVAIMAFGALKKSIEGIVEVTEEMGNSSWAAGVKAREAAYLAAAGAAAVYADNLERILKAEQTPKSEADREVKRLKEQAEAVTKLNKANEEVEMARVDVKDKAGQYHPGGADLAKAEIKYRYGLAEVENGKAVRDREIAIRSDALEKEKARLAAKLVEKKSIDEAAKGAEGEKAMVDSEKARMESNKADAKAKEEKAQKKVDAFDDKLEVLGRWLIPGYAATSYAERNAAAEQVAAAQRAQEQATLGSKKYEGQERRLGVDLPRLKGFQASLGSEVTSTAERVAAGGPELESMEQSADFQDDIAQEIFSQTAIAEFLKGQASAAAGVMKAAENTAKAMREANKAQRRNADAQRKQAERIGHLSRSQ